MASGCAIQRVDSYICRWEPNSSLPNGKHQPESCPIHWPLYGDAHYPHAYIGLSQSEFIFGDATGDQMLVAQALRDADKALVLDPNLAVAYAQRGHLRYAAQFDWAGAESDLKRALQLEPAGAEVLRYYGGWLGQRTQPSTSATTSAGASLHGSGILSM
jgi:tetratricopeptide (TPR) repeat protein